MCQIKVSPFGSPWANGNRVAITLRFKDSKSQPHHLASQLDETGHPESAPLEPIGHE